MTPGSLPVHTWRRHHGPEIVCEVEPVEALGTWRVSTWLNSDPSGAVSPPTRVYLLQSAQAKADALARRTFNHKCRLETCGDWFLR